jgi:hypothetical protein
MSADGSRMADRLAVAKAIPIEEIAERLGIMAELKRAGREWVGPCPKCGGSDRFGLNADRGVYNCRQCGGGDGIRLVELVQGVPFAGALDFLLGADTATPEEIRARARRAAEERRRREARAEAARARAIERARAIWAEAKPAEATPVRDYLERRGITRALLPDMPRALRFAPALPYFHAGAEIHRGPAMIAAILAPDGRVTAAHCTWLDLERDNGKAALEAAGAALPAKKVQGSKRAAAIRLTPHMDFETLVIGEGIETTLSARIAAPIEGAAYWAGIDLGHMGGRRILTAAAAARAGLPAEGVRAAGFPDLEDDRAFLPPPWARRLIYLQDGDSDPAETRAKLLAGLRRAQAKISGLACEIVAAPPGADFNDVLRGAGA